MSNSRGDERETITDDRSPKPQKFKEIVEQTAHAIYITDIEGNIEYVNPAFEEMTGYSAEDAFGRNPNILQSGEHEASWYEKLWETIESGEQWEQEMIDETKDGERLYLEQTISPISGPDGEITNYVAIAQDITERKEQEAKIERQRNDLELLNQVLRHDIRNHLQLVFAYGNMLDDYVSEDGIEYLEKVQRSTNNAISLTQVAKDMADVMVCEDSEFGPVELAPVLQKQIEEIRTHHNDTTVEIETSIPEVTVHANSMLGSIFRNLLSNAVQHNDKSVVEIDVIVEEEPNSVSISIADNGSGIPDTVKDTIFGHGEKGLESSGSGIGLYLVETLVSNYGGAVRVEDNEPEGAIFTVELPTVSSTHQ